MIEKNFYQLLDEEIERLREEEKEKQRDYLPSYDPDAWADEFNYMERMC